jgi:hypothetical protein
MKPDLFRLRTLGLVILAGLSSLTSRTAFADAFDLSANAVASACSVLAFPPCDTQQLETGLIPINSIVVSPINASLSVSVGGDSATASAETSGTVTYGQITGFVTGSASEANPGPAGIDSTSTSGQGTFIGQWQDTLTITSSSLQAGTPVTLDFTLLTNASLSCTGPSGTVEATATFEANLSVEQLSDNTCNTPFQQSQQMTFLTAVGDTVSVSGQLNLFASGEGANGVTSTGTADPPQSSFFIDSLTAGVSYSSASGQTYFTPASTVPEPASFLWLGIVLTGILTPRRFRPR